MYISSVLAPIAVEAAEGKVPEKLIAMRIEYEQKKAEEEETEEEGSNDEGSLNDSTSRNPPSASEDSLDKMKVIYFILDIIVE